MLAAIYVYTISPDPYKSFINARGNKVSPFLSSNDSVALSSGERSGFIRKRSYAEIENLFDRISSTSEVLVRDIKIGRGFALFSEYLPSLKQSRMDSCKKRRDQLFEALSNRGLILQARRKLLRGIKMASKVSQKIFGN